MSSIHPRHAPNLCQCGHDWRSHNVGVQPNTCRECRSTTAGVFNAHNFQSINEFGISRGLGGGTPPVFGPYFQARDLTRVITPGSFDLITFQIRTGTNSGGATTVVFTEWNPAIRVGMTFTIFPTNAQNQASYTVIAFDPVLMTVAIDRPLQGNSNNFIAQFNGVLGSNTGPGRPANGQRAG